VSREELQAAEAALEELGRLLQVTKIDGLMRFGAKNDGGYIGVASLDTPIVLSGGGGKNIDFEIELAEKGSKVHIYDPTIKKLPRNHVNITHISCALTDSNDKTFKDSVTLSEAFSDLDRAEHVPVWLKLDIEGSEIDLLSADLKVLTRFQQIFVEFHDTYKLVDPTYRSNLISILEELQKTHYLISIVSNNWQGMTNFGHAFAPVTFEATFISREFAAGFSNVNEFQSLKSVNNPNRPDIPDRPFQIAR
jgi:hypothetical protein